MAPRRRWVVVAIIAVPAALLLGRWLTARAATILWADALGVADAHIAIANLKVVLQVLAFLAAAAWCTGNLYLVYRAIGSVQVPRRLGNIEIVETVPRRYLLLGAVGVGLILAYATSHGAAEWWTARALLDAQSPAGTMDPILNRDVSYYLFRLPWQRTLHGFAVLLSGIMLAITLFLYVAVGGIRWTKRRIEVNELARSHVGALLVAFALTLFWGYRLEPLELVAGLHGVPYDTILTDVRIPAARLLSGLAVVVAGASAVWIWVGRIAVVGAAWGTLMVASFLGHYIAPAFAAASTAPDERATPAIEQAAAGFVRTAFGLSGDTVQAQLAIPDTGFPRRHAEPLRELPVWDPFAVSVILNYTARPRAFDRFFDVSLGVYPGGGEVVPILLGVREVDIEEAATLERGITWERRHGRPYAHARGAVAVHAARVTDEGLPVYVPDLAVPDSTVPVAEDLRLTDPEVWFSPATADFAVATEDEGPFRAPRVGGLLDRVAWAWTLQSPPLLFGARVPSSSFVLADRTVGQRLARLAPFARFGAAYPVVVDGGIWWVASGYLWGDAYPLSTTVRWRGREVRYLHAPLVGVVNAHTGETAVYLLPDAGLLGDAWAFLAPDVVRPPEQIPAGVTAAVRYPAELFRAQLGLLRRVDWRPGRAGGAVRTPEPFWWVGPAFADSARRLRLRAVIEVQAEPRVASIVDGTVVNGVPTLTLVAYPQPYALGGPSELAQEFAAGAGQEAAIPGPLKLAPFSDGAIGVQSFYGAGPDGEPPRLAEVVLGWRGAVGRGGTLPSALDGIQVQPRPVETSTGDTLAEAGRWFRRLDAARAAGDWAAFGEAYAALRRLFQQAAEDTTP